MKEIEFRIKGLMMDPLSNAPIVVLQEAGGETLLPIWVGIFEANAIALQIEKVEPPRPMTHDLIKGILSHLEVGVSKVVVTELLDNTFYALVFLDAGGKVIAVDARPSDAIALALRTDAPIFVTDEVVSKSNRPDAPTISGGRNAPEDIKKWLENLDPDDLGKYKM
ncbi:MAG: bifunctional nuclease family protein [Acidobacteriota bacterium]|jgi:bifunctional DNase/RNase|nr:bifunctional nuclease family protein [Acidobacteriota bacterium]